MDQIQFKVCKKCKIALPLSKFYKNRGKCKQCTEERIITLQRIREKHKNEFSKCKACLVIKKTRDSFYIRKNDYMYQCKDCFQIKYKHKKKLGTNSCTKQFCHSCNTELPVENFQIDREFCKLCENTRDNNLSLEVLKKHKNDVKDCELCSLFFPPDLFEIYKEWLTD